MMPSVPPAPPVARYQPHSMTADLPIRVAIIGSGPAGIYAAAHLLRDSDDLQVDMFERLPTPWGLVRSGVAPDHPKIKSVTRLYERTAEHPRLRLFGNVEFGEHVSREDLRRHYHAIVYAIGTPNDRALGIPGEDLPGSYAATEFVGWYNGHPDFADHRSTCAGERAVVIGNGNVALDVARMLVLTHEELAVTDIADHALEALDKSRVSEVLVVARRGPEQAAFTNPELLELGELLDSDVIVDAAELALARGIVDPRAEHDRTAQPGDPARLRGARAAGRVTADRPALPALARRDPRRGRARESVERPVTSSRQPRTGDCARSRPASGEIPAALTFRAIGYRGIPLPGVPFDERELIANKEGRVLDRTARRRRVRRRLGQARPQRRDRHQQEGRPGDGRRDARRHLRRNGDGQLLAPDPIPTAARRSLLRERQPALVDYEGWAESTATSAPRASRGAPARQAHADRRDARRSRHPKTRRPDWPSARLAWWARAYARLTGWPR